MAEDIKTMIRNFVITNFLFGDGNGLEDDASFLDEGIIDSTGILELIEYIEKEFNIEVEETEMVPENLDSISFTAKFVIEKRGLKA